MREGLLSRIVLFVMAEDLNRKEFRDMNIQIFFGLYDPLEFDVWLFIKGMELGYFLENLV